MVTAGTTILKQTGPPRDRLPSPFRPEDALFFEFQSTAIYTGPVSICIGFDSDDFAEPALLFLDGGSWSDIGAGLSGSNLCGQMVGPGMYALADASSEEPPDADFFGSDIRVPANTTTSIDLRPYVTDPDTPLSELTVILDPAGPPNGGSVTVDPVNPLHILYTPPGDWVGLVELPFGVTDGTYESFDELDIMVEGDRTLMLIVRDLTGAGPGELCAELSAVLPGGEVSIEQCTNWDGSPTTLEIEGLLPGTYAVTLLSWANGPFARVGGGQVEITSDLVTALQLEFEIEPSTGWLQVLAESSDGNRRLPGACWELEAALGGQWWYACDDDLRTDVPGSATFYSLPPGTYTLTQRPDVPMGGHLAPAPRVVTVVAGAIATELVTFSAAEALVFEAVGPSNEEVLQVCLDVWDHRDDWVASVCDGGFGDGLADGIIVLPPFPQGLYRVDIYGEDTNFYIPTIDSFTFTVNANGSVNAGTGSNVIVVPFTRGGGVEFNVAPYLSNEAECFRIYHAPYSPGDPPVEVQGGVTFCPDTDEEWLPYFGTYLITEDDRFAIDPLAPGNYVLTVLDSRLTLLQGGTFTVVDGDVTDVDVVVGQAMSPNVIALVQFTDAAGNLIEEAQVGDQVTVNMHVFNFTASTIGGFTIVTNGFGQFGPVNLPVHPGPTPYTHQLTLDITSDYLPNNGFIFEMQVLNTGESRDPVASAYLEVWPADEPTPTPEPTPTATPVTPTGSLRVTVVDSMLAPISEFCIQLFGADVAFDSTECTTSGEVLFEDLVAGTFYPNAEVDGYYQYYGSEVLIDPSVGEHSVQVMVHERDAGDGIDILFYSDEGVDIELGESFEVVVDIENEGDTDLTNLSASIFVNDIMHNCYLERLEANDYYTCELRYATGASEAGTTLHFRAQVGAEEFTTLVERELIVRIGTAEPNTPVGANVQVTPLDWIDPVFLFAQVDVAGVTTLSYLDFLPDVLPLPYRADDAEFWRFDSTAVWSGTFEICLWYDSYDRVDPHLIY